MIYLLSLNLWSPVNLYVENKRSINKLLMSKIRKEGGVYDVFLCVC